jgi:hypothetical protein
MEKKNSIKNPWFKKETNRQNEKILKSCQNSAQLATT